MVISAGGMGVASPPEGALVVDVDVDMVEVWNCSLLRLYERTVFLGQNAVGGSCLANTLHNNCKCDRYIFYSGRTMQKRRVMYDSWS